MRILLITGLPHPFSEALYQHLAREPDFIITQVAPADYNAPSEAFADDRPRNVLRLPATLGSLGSSDDPHRVFIKPIHLHLKQAQPDLVVCQFEQESVAAAQTALACGLLQPTVPLTLYSWQNILRHRSLAVRAVDFLTLRRASHITCASKEAVEVLQRKGFRGSTGIAPLIGVDERHFHKQSGHEIHALRARHNIDGFAVGYAGRLVLEKSVDTLIDAFAQLEPPATLAVIGSGDASDMLRRRAQNLGVFDRCRFIEQVSYEQMPAYLSMLDALVLPSRTTSNWKEQFGRVLAEAMACGVPVVGSDSGAIPEVIADAGLVFPEGDARALAQRLRLLIDHPDQRITLVEQGTRRIAQCFSFEALAQQTADTWRQLVSKTQ